MKFLPRPGHADYSASIKYGGFNDYRGGGRFSGRVTVGLVMAGAVAKKLLKLNGIEVLAHTIQIGEIKANVSSTDEIRRHVYNNPLRCADSAGVKKMTELIQEVGKQGESLGGIIEGLALNVPAGLGEPYFDTMEGELAKALLAIPAVKGVEFGAGFSVATKKGSENNDSFIIKGDKVITETNNSGGILGGSPMGILSGQSGSKANSFNIARAKNCGYDKVRKYRNNYQGQTRCLHRTAGGDSGRIHDSGDSVRFCS